MLTIVLSLSIPLCTNSLSALAHLPITALVSSSLSSSPRFLIAPAFGASSRGFAASAFRYAVCNARTLVAWWESDDGFMKNHELILGDRGTDLLLVMQALVVILQHWRTFPLS